MASEPTDEQSHVLTDVAQPEPPSPRCSVSPTVVSTLHDGAEETSPSNRASPTPPTEAPPATPDNTLLQLPSIQSLLPEKVFQKVLAVRETTPPLTSGTDPSLFQTTCRRDSLTQVITIYARDGCSPPPEQGSPTINECPSDPPYSRSGSGIGEISHSVSPGSHGIELLDVRHDSQGDHSNIHPPAHHPPPDYPMDYSTHCHCPHADFWAERGPRSGSPMHRPDPEPPIPESTGNNHGPKTRKAWTNFEREVIKEYCIRLLKTPEYAGETVLPPDPEIWEDIKDALWEMYPGRFQRSRQGIMELARKMNLRRGTREELSKRQTRPKELFKSQIASNTLQHHTNRARRKSVPNTRDDGMVNAPR